MSVTSQVPSPVHPAGPRRGASRLGYWVGGGLAAAACIGAVAWVVLAFFGLTNQVNGFQRMTVPGTATVHVAQAAARVLYFEGPRTAPSGQLGIQVTGPAGNPVAVSSYHGDLRYDVPGESGRVGKAIASFRAAATGDYQISADPGTGAAGTIAIGGDVLWDVVPHIAGAAAVFLAGVAAGGTLIIVTAVRRSGRRAASRNTP
jgi:hypothetical protein